MAVTCTPTHTRDFLVRDGVARVLIGRRQHVCARTAPPGERANESAASKTARATPTPRMGATLARAPIREDVGSA